MEMFGRIDTINQNPKTAVREVAVEARRLEQDDAALPDGLSLTPNSLHVTGTTAPGSSVIELRGTDIAGSTLSDLSDA